MKLPDLLRLVYPEKCVLCTRLLPPEQTGLCHDCRANIKAYPTPRIRLPHLESWAALWYYEDDVRASILRFKFGHRPAYAKTYGQLLAVQVIKMNIRYDVLTWVPTAQQRQRKRGYDQVALLAKATARQLGTKAVPVLKKIRNNPPQSGLGNAAQRRANVLGAYRLLPDRQVAGKRILLIDDVITTGATAGECARMLLTAGAREVHLLCVAAANH